METIALLAAMPQESNAVLHVIPEHRSYPLGPYRCQRFHLAERDCWLVTSGMGIHRAAQASRALIDAAHPQLLISVGVAGAVHADLAIGDVVLSSNTCLLEQGMPGSLQPLAQLSEPAWQAAVQALHARSARLFRGTAITTRGAQFVLSRPEQMPHPVLEMETVGIARVAAEKGLPLISLRAISDGPQSSIPFDLEAAMDDDYNLRIGEILKALLRHPRILPLLLRMGRNTDRAAQNAAVALLAVLTQSAQIISE